MVSLEFWITMLPCLRTRDNRPCAYLSPSEFGRGSTAKPLFPYLAKSVDWESYTNFPILVHRLLRCAHMNAFSWIGKKVKEWTGTSSVPTGFAIFMKENTHPPREWAERFVNVQRWTRLPKGGHFGVLEEPGLLARELREFFRTVR